MRWPRNNTNLIQCQYTVDKIQSIWQLLSIEFWIKFLTYEKGCWNQRKYLKEIMCQQLHKWYPFKDNQGSHIHNRDVFIVKVPKQLRKSFWILIRSITLMGIDFQCVYWVKRSIIEVYRVTQGKTVLSVNSMFLLQFKLVDLIDVMYIKRNMIINMY